MRRSGRNTYVGKADFIHGLVDVLQRAHARLRDAFVEGLEDELVLADALVGEYTRARVAHANVFETLRRTTCRTG